MMAGLYILIVIVDMEVNLHITYRYLQCSWKA